MYHHDKSFISYNMNSIVFFLTTVTYLACITDTWLDENAAPIFEAAVPTNYSVIHNLRLDRRRGNLLVSRRLVSGNDLPQPVLKKITTDDTRGNIIKGDTVTVKCVNGAHNADKFFLLHKKENGQNETLEGSSGEFLFQNINSDKDGDYLCKYCEKTSCSAFSTPLNVYVQEKFPRPSIRVSPRRVVQPGAAIEITCETHRSNIKFTLLKNDVPIQISDSGKTLSYIINPAKDENNGYYSCTYESKSGSSVHLVSAKSNPMKITVLELPSPSITCEEDPNDSQKFIINCTVPNNQQYKRLNFKLLNGSKITENTKDYVKDKTVTFTVVKPQYVTKKYFCMYQITNDFMDTEDSLYSEAIHLWEDLPEPSMYLQPDSTSNEMKIRCNAPRAYKGIRFQLLDDTRMITEQAANDTSSTIFTINSSAYLKERISCSYRIKLDCGFVDSRPCRDFSGTYTLMFIRHILSALVLILMGIIILVHFRGFRETEESAPSLPPTRVRFGKATDNTRVVLESEN